MPAAEQPPSNSARSVSPAELQQIVKVFAESDLRELRLSVGDVDLLVSRNEQVDAPTPRTTPSPAAQEPPAADAKPVASRPSGVSDAPAAPPLAAGRTEQPTESARAGLVEIRSPAIGTFYRRPAPDKPPFVEVGTVIEVGDAVGTIEVMKMFTTVTADVAGTVKEICVEDAVLVEHGQVLVYVDPSAS